MLKPIVIIVVASLLPFMNMAAQGFSDEFNGSVDPRWEWIRADVTRQLVLGSQLTIITQNGALYGDQFNNARNLLLQNAPLGSYQIETKVNFAGDSTFHNAGLLYYIDDDNFVNASKGFYLGQHVAMVAWEEEGNWSIRTVAIDERATLYLRLTARENVHFTAEYSPDGISWEIIDSFWTGFSVSSARIGLKAANGEGVNVTQRQIPARFDYFRLNTTVSVRGLLRPIPNAVSLSIFPVPAPQGSTVTVELISPTEMNHLDVFSIDGTLMRHLNVTGVSPGLAYIKIPTHGLAPGLYYVIVRNSISSASVLLPVLR